MLSAPEETYGIGVLDDNVFEGRETFIDKVKHLFFSPAPKERRKSPRVNISVPVICQIGDQQGPQKENPLTFLPPASGYLFRYRLK